MGTTRLSSGSGSGSSSSNSRRRRRRRRRKWDTASMYIEDDVSEGNGSVFFDEEKQKKRIA